MGFEPLDRYLLAGTGQKERLVNELLAHRSELPAAAPFYEGMRMLGGRTPDLTFIALRLVLAGKKADDQSVVRLRAIVERARAGDAQAACAYDAELNG